MALQAVDNGPLTTCQDEAIAWMVETSNNVASVITTDNSIDIVASQRSNVMSNLENMTNTVKAAFQLAGAKITVGDKYPAWKMRTDSKLTEITVKSYEKLFGKKPLVKGIHAGLECGLFSENILIWTWLALALLSEKYTLHKKHSISQLCRWYGIIFWTYSAMHLVKDKMFSNRQD